MKYSLVALAFLFASLSAASDGHAECISLNDITKPIVPTWRSPNGTRDFHGSVTMDVVVRLTIERRGRAIFAHTKFTARATRRHKRNRSQTFIEPAPILVWRWRPADGLRFVHAINSRPVSELRHVSASGCCGCAMIGEYEDGGVIVTVPVNDGLVRDVKLLGDTCGDDISTDNDPHGDTSIRRIRFNRIDVTFGRTLRPARPGTRSGGLLPPRRRRC